MRPTVRSRLRHAWHTVNGLVTLLDVLSKLGFWLYRGSLRRTMGVAVALGAVLLVDQRIDAFGMTPGQALTGTGAILIVSCFGGLLLMFISGSFARSQLTLAEAKGSNLLEEMKKSRAVEHRQRLWDRVIRYEQMRFTSEARSGEAKLIQENRQDFDYFCHPSTNRTLSNQRRCELEQRLGELGRTREGWELMFDYMSQIPLARSVLKHQLRYDLSKIKDWYDGAPFHHTDTKLQEQFDGTEDLQAAKAEAGLRWWFFFSQRRKRQMQSVWFSIITRAIHLRVARTCRLLDDQFPAFHFAPDQFLWPSEQTLDIVRQQAGAAAAQALIAHRKKIFHRVFSPESHLAHALMHRAIYPNFEAASHLRRRYDPAYVLGELEQTWENDGRRYHRAFRPIERAEAKRRLYTRRVAAEQSALADFLQTHSIDGADEPETNRAIRIAVHTNRQDLNRIICGHIKVADTVTAERIQEVVGEKRVYTRKLLAVRIHHELARIELEDYEFYVNQILH